MKPILDSVAVDQLLTRGVEMVYPTKDAFKTRLLSGAPVRIYFGIDPTSPALHIGHALGLRKMKAFQDLGHEVILLLGSFTGMVGDPTDKSATRQQLTLDQVLENAATYKKQAGKILSFRGKNPAKIMMNHKWLAKLTLKDSMELASHFTVQQLLERDMFDRRIKEGKPIRLHEFMYPLLQGYDSVAMDVDAEMGGNDQTFNMLAGRTLMKEIKHKEKFVLSLKLLTNSEGKKMSKTEGGFVALTDSPEEMFGKIMAMSDSMITPYFELMTDLPLPEIEGMKVAMKGGLNPKDLKMKLAHQIVSMYQDEKSADKAQENFVNVFSNKEKPAEMTEFKVKGSTSIIDLLVESKLVASKSEARRLIADGGVKIDDAVIKDISYMVELKAGEWSTLQKGKRFFVKLVS